MRPVVVITDVSTQSILHVCRHPKYIHFNDYVTKTAELNRQIVLNWNKF